MAAEPWSFRNGGFASVDGSCPTRTDVESCLAHLVEIQQGQSRPSVWPWVLSSLSQEEVPKHLQLLLWFEISLAMAFAQPTSKTESVP